MKVIETTLPGVLLVEPQVHRDERGFFLESYHARKYQEVGISEPFVQDNHSRSARGILRGLHMQLEHMQDKLVRAVEGRIFDVAVDVRRGSPHFAKYVAIELSSDDHHQLFVPRGFAHGFLVLSEFAEVEYKCTDFYHPGSELGIAWNDPRIGIPWPEANPLLSAKDAEALTLEQAMDRLPKFEG